jgi:hypothetical protein
MREQYIIFLFSMLHPQHMFLWPETSRAKTMKRELGPYREFFWYHGNVQKQVDARWLSVHFLLAIKDGEQKL